MREIESNKTIFHFGKIILKELAYEGKISDFAELKFLDDDFLITYEQSLKSGRRISYSSKLIFAIRQELNARKFVWSFENESWSRGHGF